MLFLHGMDLDLLASLSEVARQGAITGAARTLGITQPALSRRLQQLEEIFDAPLLVRGRAGASLTELGHLVEAEGRQILERFERLRQDVAARLRLEAGTVRIGGGATAVSFLLPGIIRAFGKERPGIVFEVKEAGSREVADAVAREELELGIVTLPVHAPGLALKPFRRDPIVLVASADHPLARRERVPASALRGEALVGFEAGSAIRRLIDRALARRGVEMNVVMELRSIQSILRMAGLGLGLAFVSRLGVDEGDPRIRVLTVTGLKVERTLAVATRRGRPLSPAADEFLRHLA